MSHASFILEGRGTSSVAATGRARHLALAGAVLLGVLGCSDPLLEPDRIERTRVLGARVESAGAPDRAWPRPGDSLSVRWFVVDPGAAVPLGFALSACVAGPATKGVPSCRSEPFAFATRSEPGLGEPTLTFATPDASALGDDGHIEVTGVICAGSRPRAAAPWPNQDCEGASSGITRVAFEVEIERDGRGNHNPSLTTARIRLDSVDWSAPGELATDPLGCGSVAPGPALPRLAGNGAAHSIAVTLSGDDREQVAAGPDHPAFREELELSHFVTRGDLDRASSFVEAADERASSEVTVRWTAPTSAPAEGVRVRFHFVARDLRGGTDWTSREVCLVP